MCFKCDTMNLQKIYLFCLLINIILAFGVNSKYTCPSQCLCLIERGYEFVDCSNHNFIDVNLKGENVVELYDLSHNSIRKLEDYCFQNMQLTSLIELNLSDNIIDWIGLHALAKLDELEVLNLSGNRLQSFTPDQFYYNGKLKSLDLSRNKLWSIKQVPFLQHYSMEVLNLSDSQISHIPNEMFTQLPSLRNLDLSNNHMRNLNIYVLEPLTKLTTLNLDGNQWSCNKEFKKLQPWIKLQVRDYNPQCRTMKPKMSEKMISLVDAEYVSSIPDIDEIWKDRKNDSKKKISSDRSSSTVQPPPFVVTEVVNVYPLITFVLGALVGLLFGMVFSYCWLTQCFKYTCGRSADRRQDRRNGTGTPLISPYRNIINSESTPITTRRQISQENSTCRSTSWQLEYSTGERRGLPMITAPPAVFRAIYKDTNRSESPPPTYRESLSDSVIPT